MGSSWGWPWYPRRRHCLWCRSTSQDIWESLGLSWRLIPSAGRDTDTEPTGTSASSISVRAPACLGQEEREAVWMSFLKFLLSGLLRGDGQPAYNPSRYDNAQHRVEHESEGMGKRERKGGRRESKRSPVYPQWGGGARGALQLPWICVIFLSQELLPECTLQE